MLCTVSIRLLMDDAARQRAAVCTWWCELLTLILTVVYCTILAHDIEPGKELMRITSPSWLQHGFCISRAGSAFSSHTLCFFGDLLGGTALLWENLRRFRHYPCVHLKVPMAVSAFTVLHGLGHFVIGNMVEKDFMSKVRPKDVSPELFVLYFVLTLALLALGPFLGHCNGVNPWVCIVLHILSAWAFLFYVPTQFVFGFVQLTLNAWYCAPRVALLGCESLEQVALRVDNGWATVSYGFFALMPVVFLEMLACDAFLIDFSGHFIYDGVIVVIVLAYSRSIWQEFECGPGAKAT